MTKKKDISTVKTKKTKKLSNKRKTALTTSVLGVGVCAAVSNYFYNKALNPKVASKKGVIKKVQAPSNNWISVEAPYIDVNITSIDGLNLHGYQILNAVESDTWVITVHGYMGEGLKMASYAQHFYEYGYNVLVPDLRGHGYSDGDCIGMGWLDKDDIIMWINSLIKTNPDCKIILHGVSMGAATVMMVSGEDLPSNVKLIIEDCGYCGVQQQFAHVLKTGFKLPTFPIINSASLLSRIKEGYTFTEASSIKQLEKAKVPILFIHGSEDNFVPFSMLDELYNTAKVPKEKLIVDGAQHATSSTTNPKLYWTSIKNFIDTHINTNDV